MLIHTSQLDPLGSQLSGTETTDILQLNEPGIKVTSMVAYDLNVGLSDGGIFATGTLVVDLEFCCVRCNEPFASHLVVSNFAVQEDLLGVETFDLTPHMREDILLALPIHPRCDQDGDRQCSGLFSTDRAVPQQSVDDRWNALDQLDLPENI